MYRDYTKICRVCMSDGSRDIFPKNLTDPTTGETGTSCRSPSSSCTSSTSPLNRLVEKLRYVTMMKIDENDDLPRSLCDLCIVQLNVAYNFKRQAVENDTKLRQYFIENGITSSHHNQPIIPQVVVNNIVDVSRPGSLRNSFSGITTNSNSINSNGSNSNNNNNSNNSNNIQIPRPIVNRNFPIIPFIVKTEPPSPPEVDITDGMVNVIERSVDGTAGTDTDGMSDVTNCSTPMDRLNLSNSTNGSSIMQNSNTNQFNATTTTATTERRNSQSVISINNVGNNTSVGSVNEIYDRDIISSSGAVGIITPTPSSDIEFTENNTTILNNDICTINIGNDKNITNSATVNNEISSNIKISESLETSSSSISFDINAENHINNINNDYDREKDKKSHSKSFVKDKNSKKLKKTRKTTNTITTTTHLQKTLSERQGIITGGDASNCNNERKNNNSPILKKIRRRRRVQKLPLEILRLAIDMNFPLEDITEKQTNDSSNPRNKMLNKIRRRTFENDNRGALKSLSTTLTTKSSLLLNDNQNVSKEKHSLVINPFNSKQQEKQLQNQRTKLRAKSQPTTTPISNIIDSSPAITKSPTIKATKSSTPTTTTTTSGTTPTTTPATTTTAIITPTLKPPTAKPLTTTSVIKEHNMRLLKQIKRNLEKKGMCQRVLKPRSDFPLTTKLNKKN